MNWMKYLLAAFIIVMVLAVGVYVDCRTFQGDPEMCRNMVFTRIGDRIGDWIPHFK